MSRTKLSLQSGLALGIFLKYVMATVTESHQNLTLTEESPLTVTSPEYPDLYPSLIFYTWVIESPPNTSIGVQVLDFQLEQHSKAKDILYVGNGLNYTLVEEGFKMQLGASKVQQLITSGPEMWLVFTTDSSARSDRGFKLQLRVLNETDTCASDEFVCHDAILVCMDNTIECDGPPHCADETDESKCEHCGQTNIDLSGVVSHTVTSPKYPSEFPYKILCQWLVNASDDAFVLLSFLKFNMKEYGDLFSVGTGHDPSNASSVVFMRRGSMTPIEMALKSHQVWLSFKTTGNAYRKSIMHVDLQEFKPKECQDDEFACDSGLACIPQTAVCNGLPECSDQSDELNCYSDDPSHCQIDQGWCSCLQKSDICNGAVDCLDFYDELHCEPCGEPFIQLTNDNTPFNMTSPNYPSIYPSEMSCLWLITAEPDHRIILSFTDFKLNIETLSVGNGHHPSEQQSLIVRCFGATTPAILTSEGSKLWITFETLSGIDSRSLYRGYSLAMSQFVTVECGVDEFPCASGHQCVTESYYCDGVTHCLDFSDEFGCGTCSSDQFSCTSACVVPEGICNGLVECEDFKDETGCGNLCEERSIILTQELPEFNLTSSGYVSLDDPGSIYPPRYSCFWTVSTEPSLQIAFKVLYISLKARAGDAIRLGNGHDPSFSITGLAFFNGKDDSNVQGKTYLSSGSKMWITKVTAEDNSFAKWAAFSFEITRYNSSGECLGFRCVHDSYCIPQTDLCDGIANCGDFTDEQLCAHCGAENSTIIDVSGSSQDSPHLLSVLITNEISLFRFGKDCIWTITAQSGTRIQLRFLNLILISDSYYNNGIMVGNGHNPGNLTSVILSQTGKVIRELLTSSGAHMWITVDTYLLQFEEGFSAILNQYGQKECFTDQYMCPSGLRCIDVSKKCDGVPDCPQIEDEFGCGSCLPNQLQCDEGAVCLDQNQMCDGTGDCADDLDERFCAPCGDYKINLPRDPPRPMNFSSPSYSIINYPSSMKCQWLITGMPNYRIQLEFVTFQTEVKYDIFSVGNGHSPGVPSSVILEGISGTEAPRIIVSLDYHMWITFTTDQRVSDKGFLLLITQTNETVECNEDDTSCPTVPGVVCLHHQSRCNGIAICPDKSDEDMATCGSCGSTVIYLFGTGDHNLTSPAYPSNYPSEQNCGWLIQTYEKPSDDAASATPDDWRLQATIELFDLENQWDYLTLYNYGNEKLTDPIARLTGRIKLTTVVSSGPAMYIRFQSDKTGTEKGFRINFHSINKTSGFCHEDDFDCDNNELCVSDNALCNGFNDCFNFKDEESCSEINCPGDYECDSRITTDADLRNFQCITTDLVCNGRADCPEEDDEIQCDKKKCPATSCDCSYDNKGLIIVCSGSWDQNTVDVMAKTVYTLSLTGGNVTVLRQGTFKGMASLHTLSLSNNHIVTVEPRTFDGLDNLTWLELSGNSINELQSYSFQELRRLEGLTLWNVSLMNIQDNAFSGLQHLKKLAIVRGVKNSKVNVGDKGFEGIPNLQELIVDDHRLCCYFPEVTCTSLEPRPPLFMCSNLMPNLALRIFMWILGISALIGNLGVILWRFREKNSKSSKIVHSFLVFNLAVSDFLMGVYMVIIAAADIYYGDAYFKHASEWRSSIMCKVASAISILSSEASVFIVTVITIDRFLCIVLPFSQFHLRRKSSKIVLFGVWCVSLTVSLVPTILADEESNFYGLSDVCIGLPLRTRPTSFSKVTKNVGSPISNGTFSIPVALSYEPSWVFSIVLFLGVNMLCFLTILICYIVIFIHVQLSVKQVNRHMHRFEEIKMAAKMGLIVGTDLLCWLPIITMGILAQCNVVIPVEMYAWTVVFILPINSSLNPYLYTASSCLADRRKGQLSTVPRRNRTMPTLPMTDKVNFEKNTHTQEFSVID